MERQRSEYHLKVTEWGSQLPELGRIGPVPLLLFVALPDNTR